MVRPKHPKYPTTVEEVNQLFTTTIQFVYHQQKSHNKNPQELYEHILGLIDAQYKEAMDSGLLESDALSDEECLKNCIYVLALTGLVSVVFNVAAIVAEGDQP